MQKTKRPNISVLIPTFNGASTIGATLTSALAQTLTPLEILVMDDGSTDNTAEIVKSFIPKVTLLQQHNKGVSSARNELIKKASGDFIAFLDHDDFWYPQYLELQLKTCKNYPNAVVSFTGFHNVYGNSEIPNCNTKIMSSKSSLIKPVDLLESYNRSSGFIKPSFCMFRYQVLHNLGENPLPEDLKGTDDVYLWYRLALLGPFARSHAKAGLYRIFVKGLSNDRLMNSEERVEALKKVYDVYDKIASPPMLKVIKKHLADNYRTAAKYQMGAENIFYARQHLKRALNASFGVKSAGYLLVTYLPNELQPQWPQRWRA